MNKKNLKLLSHINSYGIGGGGGGNGAGCAGAGNSCAAKRFAENFSMSNLESRLNLAKSLNSISAGGGGGGGGSSSCSKIMRKKVVQQCERSSPAILVRSNAGPAGDAAGNSDISLVDTVVSRVTDQAPTILPITIGDPQAYDRQALLKRFTEDFYTLDKDMHFEFCVRKLGCKYNAIS